MRQHNDFREAIESDRAVFGARASTFSETIVEIYGSLGIDFVWLDFEHMGPSPYDSTIFENLTRAAEVSGTELLVRLPSGDPSLVRKTLDAGVRNIFIPRVDSAEEIREAVKASRFVYDDEPGERGMASGRARTWGESEDYVASEDENVCIGVMIEKTTAVDEIEDILAVPELGFAFIGPSDLSVQLGHPGEKTHNEVRSSIEGIEEACRSAGVPMGCIANDRANIERALKNEYKIIRVGGDVSSIRSTLKQQLSQIEEIQSN